MRTRWRLKQVRGRNLFPFPVFFSSPHPSPFLSSPSPLILSSFFFSTSFFFMSPFLFPSHPLLFPSPFFFPISSLSLSSSIPPLPSAHFPPPFHALHSSSLYSEVKLYLMVLDKLGKTERKLEVIRGELGKSVHPPSNQLGVPWRARHCKGSCLIPNLTACMRMSLH